MRYEFATVLVFLIQQSPKIPLKYMAEVYSEPRTSETELIAKIVTSF